MSGKYSHKKKGNGRREHKREVARMQRILFAEFISNKYDHQKPSMNGRTDLTFWNYIDPKRTIQIKLDYPMDLMV